MAKETITTAQKRAYLEKVVAHLIETNKISLKFIQTIRNSSLSEEDSQELLAIAEDFQSRSFKFIQSSNHLIDDMGAKEIEEAIATLDSQREQLLGLLDEVAKLNNK